jgi:hypothetical protein
VTVITPDRHAVEERFRRLQRLAAAVAPPPPEPTPEPAPEPAAPPPEPPAVEAPRVRCETCAFFAPLSISGPITFAFGRKGRCLAGPPTVPVEQHYEGTEMQYRLVGAGLPGCTHHPEFGRD